MRWRILADAQHALAYIYTYTCLYTYIHTYIHRYTHREHSTEGLVLRSDLPPYLLIADFRCMNHESDPSCQVRRGIDCRESRRRLELTHSRRITIRRLTLKRCVSSFAYRRQSRTGKYWYRPSFERQVPDKSRGCSGDDLPVTVHNDRNYLWWFAISLR